jgi:hypothetical protein
MKLKFFPYLGAWALGLLLLAGCRQQTKNLFTLEAQLAHLKSDTVYLLGNDLSFDRIDTLVVRKGVLHYETELDTLVPFTLLCNDTVLLPFYGDRGMKVQLTFDAKKPQQWSVTGGEENQALQEFRHWADTVRSVERLEAGVDTVLHRHPLSPAGIRLLNRYLVQQRHPNYKRLSEMITQMSGLLHDDPMVSVLEERVDRSLRADTGRYVSSFQARNLKGNSITSYTFRDKPLVVCFAASWDKQSKAVVDSLKRLQPKYKEKVGFLFHSLDIDPHQWRRAVEADTLYGEQTSAPEGWEANIVKLFAVQELPTVVLLNRQRRVFYKRTDLKDFSHTVDSLLKLDKLSEKFKH